MDQFELSALKCNFMMHENSGSKVETELHHHSAHLNCYTCQSTKPYYRHDLKRKTSSALTYKEYQLTSASILNMIRWGRTAGILLRSKLHYGYYAII